MKLVFCMFLVSLGLAGEPIVTAELSTRDAWVADPVDLQIRIHFDDRWSFELTPLDKSLAEASVLNHRWLEVHKDLDTGLNVLELKAELAWYKIGTFKVPTIELKGTDGAGEAHVFSTPNLEIEIKAMLDESDTAVAPPRGQVDLQFHELWPWLLMAALVILALAIVLIYRWRRGGEPKPVPVIPPKPAYEEALARLHELTHGSLLKEGKFKPFYVEINLIIRHYYGRLFGIPAEEMTTYELGSWFVDHRMKAEVGPLNDPFQELCDMVKYAKYEPVESEHNEVVNLAHQIIEKLKPTFEEDAHVAVG